MALEEKVQFFERQEELRLSWCFGRKPFDITPEMLKTTYALVNSYGLGDISRASTIHAWMKVNMELGYRSRSSSREPGNIWGMDYRYRSASETFRLREGSDSDFSILYATMAKIAGFRAGIAAVLVAQDGSKDQHMCSWIEYRHEPVLIDMTHGFGVERGKYYKFSDKEAVDIYNEFCLSFKNRNWKAFQEASDKLSTMLGEAVGGVPVKAISGNDSSCVSDIKFGERGGLSNKALMFLFFGTLGSSLVCAGAEDIVRMYNKIESSVASFVEYFSEGKHASRLHTEDAGSWRLDVEEYGDSIIPAIGSGVDWEFDEGDY